MYVKYLTRIALATSLILLAGCEEKEPDQQVESEKVSTALEPTAIFALAPGQLRGQYSILKDSRLRNVSRSFDKDRPAAVLFMEVGSKACEPVIYLPVNDYDGFLDRLESQFRLQRAVASSFKFGRTKLYVKQVEDYAVIGASLNGIKWIPTNLKPYFDEMPEDFDFAYRLNSKSGNKIERKLLARSIHDMFGREIARMFYQCETLNCDLKFSPEGEMIFHAQVNPAPSNVDEIQNYLDEASVENGWKATTDFKDESLAFEIKLPSDQSRLPIAWLEPSVIKSFKKDVSASAQHGVRREDTKRATGPFGMPFQTGSPGSTSLPQGTVGSGCSGRRS